MKRKDPVTPELRDAVLRRCSCGRAISKRATNCRWCRPYSTRPLAERFWEKVEQGPGCWEWMAGRDSATGYGRIRIGRAGSKHQLAHRVSWELANGPIPDGLWVLHHCDNPPCVNPAHLYLGTTIDNNRDRDARGRTARGERWYDARPWVAR